MLQTLTVCQKRNNLLLSILCGFQYSPLGKFLAAYVKCWMLPPWGDGAEATWNSGLHPGGDE